jgi:TPR repeat protein
MKLEILERMARDGIREMQFLLGFLKEHGLGCEKEVVEAHTWYRRSAEKGFAPAAYMLFYANSRHKNQMEARPHTDAEDSAALDWCRKAAREGFAPAQLDLASFASSPAESFQLALSAAEQGYAHAAFYLGALCETGYPGIEQDLQAALKWFKKASELGEESAACAVARMYREGKGLEKDEVAAFQWYLKAFEMKSHAAAFALGQIYATGSLGQDKDATKADFYNTKGMEYMKRWGNSFEHPNRASETDKDS